MGSGTLPLNTQRSLFDVSPPIHCSAGACEVPSPFYTQGWTLTHNVSGIDEAMAYTSALLSGLDAGYMGAYASFLPRLRLAKADRLPACEPAISESFQALHFDMGLPLVERKEQAGYFFTLLYYPYGADAGSAYTRIVQVDELLRQRTFGSRRECDERLRIYADEYGDGWTEPRRYSTGRLGCLARVVDAMLDRHELVDFFDLGTWEWFKDGPASIDGRRELAHETAWWERHGYSPVKVESTIRLQPGDLLVIDNIRCAHGRIGARSTEEIWQVMWGVPHVDPREVASIRAFLSSALAGSCE